MSQLSCIRSRPTVVKSHDIRQLPASVKLESPLRYIICIIRGAVVVAR